MRKQSLQPTLGPMEVTSVNRGEPSRSTAVNRSDRDWLELVGRALGRAGISQKAAAADMGIEPSLLSAQLSDSSGKHLSFLRMKGLPPAFWQELLVLVADFYGLAFDGNEDARADAELGRRVRETAALLLKAGVR